MSDYFELEFEVARDEVGMRLDTVLSNCLQKLYGCSRDSSADNLPDLLPSRSKVARWIEDGLVRVDGCVQTKSSTKLKLHSQLELRIPPPKVLTIEPDSEVTLNIVFEDEHLLIINKDPGQVVHPGAGQHDGTLVSGLLHHLGDGLRQIGDSLRPGIVHRLDKGTSGLLVVAKSETAYRHLTQQFLPPRTVHREYIALTRALPQFSVSEDKISGSIRKPIGRHPKHRTLMSVDSPLGVSAITHWKLLEELRYAYLLGLQLETGRTHQIRVHLKSENAPILGDPQYGVSHTQLPPGVREAAKGLNRQALHAKSLSFLHPVENREVSFSAPTPEDMKVLIEACR